MEGSETYSTEGSVAESPETETPETEAPADDTAAEASETPVASAKCNARDRKRA